MHTFAERVPAEQVSTLSQFLVDEIFLTLGLSPTGWPRKVTGPIFSFPTQRLSQIAIEFDSQIIISGIRAAFEWALPFFANEYQVIGMEQIPKEGPLLVIANHPGTMDTILISSILPRNDLKIIAGYSPFTQNLPNLCKHLIFSTPDTNARAGVVRTAIQHLQSGGALLLYPGGRLEPDPATLPGALESIQNWSRSIELFLRAVPESYLVKAIVSHVLLPQFLRHPLARIRKQPKDQQRVAEFFQTMYQMLFPKRFLPNPLLTFSQPVCAAELHQQAGRQLTPTILAQVQQLLETHQAHYPFHFSSAR